MALRCGTRPIQHGRTASIAAELGPFLLGLVLDKPLQELHRGILFLGVRDDRDALAAKRRIPCLPVGPAGLAK